MFQWNDYLQLAKESEQQGSSSPIQEAYLRSAISRAYYAAFHKALDFAKKQGFPEPRFNKHIRVRDFLIQHQEQSIVLVGTMLDDCRKSRGQCDYDNPLNLKFTNLNSKCSKVIQWSEFIIRNLP